MQKKVLLILLLSIGYCCVAQQLKKIKGKVVYQTLSVEGVHVINKTTKSVTITDSEGRFQITAKSLDTVVFSAIQYNLKELIIKPVFFQQNEIVVHLDKRLTELDEVVVKPHNLTGILKEDIALVKPPINFYDVGIPGFKGIPQEKIPSTATVIAASLLGGLPMETLLKKINGYYKTLKLLRKMDRENKATLDIIDFYGESFFITEYDLTLDQVYPFVLGLVLTTEIESHFYANNHQWVLERFNTKK